MLNMDKEIVRKRPRPMRAKRRAIARFTARDANAEGHFIIAVKTTGIYCRPNCPARPAKRENIEFFDDIASARRAGYRACLRCKPDEPPQGVAHRRDDHEGLPPAGARRNDPERRRRWRARPVSARAGSIACSSRRPGCRQSNMRWPNGSRCFAIG